MDHQHRRERPGTRRLHQVAAHLSAELPPGEGKFTYAALMRSSVNEIVCARA